MPISEQQKRLGPIFNELMELIGEAGKLPAASPELDSAKVIADWREGREKLAAEVRKYILDPFAMIAGAISGERAMQFCEPDVSDLGRLLSLMVMGAHRELDMYCSPEGGHMSPMTYLLEDAPKDDQGGAV